MSDEIAWLGAAELARRYRAGTLSPVEVTGALLERIERLDPDLGAFVHVAPRRALDAARRSESAFAAGRPRGPLEGVPVGLKDLLDTADMPTAAGSRVFARRAPARDAAVVARLREGGAVLLGKLSLHEFAFGITNVNRHLAPCRNPWDARRVTGGSSGGNAAALAAGLCPLAVGTDTGGSIRIPSAACGVTGLKPTFGRVSRTGVVPLSTTLDHVGPMARSAEDAALLLDAIAGHDPSDPGSTAGRAAPARPAGEEVAGLTLGVPLAWMEGIQPEVARAFDRALAALERLGARRRLVTLPPIEPIYTAVFTIIATEAASFHREWLARRPGDYGDDVRRNLAIGLCVPETAIAAVRAWQARFRRAMEEALRGVDAIVTPTLPRTALGREEPVSREPHEAWNRLVVAFNLSGLPALSLPCGFDASGLPIGLQVAGRPFDEATVLRIGTAYERVSDGRGRRPPGLD